MSTTGLLQSFDELRKLLHEIKQSCEVIDSPQDVYQRQVDLVNSNIDKAWDQLSRSDNPDDIAQLRQKILDYGGQLRDLKVEHLASVEEKQASHDDLVNNTMDALCTKFVLRNGVSVTKSILSEVEQRLSQAIARWVGPVDHDAIEEGRTLETHQLDCSSSSTLVHSPADDAASFEAQLERDETPKPRRGRSGVKRRRVEEPDENEVPFRKEKILRQKRASRNTVDTRQHQEQPLLHDPTPGDIYMAYWEKSREWWAVLILPWDHLEDVGVSDTLEGLGLLDDLPACCTLITTTGKLRWAKKYGDGGSLVKERQFPVMYFDGAKFPEKSSVGWVAVKDLKMFEFETSGHSLVPHYNSVREYVRWRATQGTKQSSIVVRDTPTSDQKDQDVPNGETFDETQDNLPSQRAPTAEMSPQEAEGQETGTFEEAEREATSSSPSGQQTTSPEASPRDAGLFEPSQGGESNSSGISSRGPSQQVGKEPMGLDNEPIAMDESADIETASQVDEAFEMLEASQANEAPQLDDVAQPSLPILSNGGTEAIRVTDAAQLSEVVPGEHGIQNDDATQNDATTHDNETMPTDETVQVNEGPQVNEVIRSKNTTPVNQATQVSEAVNGHLNDQPSAADGQVANSETSNHERRNVNDATDGGDESIMLEYVLQTLAGDVSPFQRFQQRLDRYNKTLFLYGDYDSAPVEGPGSSTEPIVVSDDDSPEESGFSAPVPSRVATRDGRLPDESGNSMEEDRAEESIGISSSNLLQELASTVTDKLERSERWTNLAPSAASATSNNPLASVQHINTHPPAAQSESAQPSPSHPTTAGPTTTQPPVAFSTYSQPTAGQPLASETFNHPPHAVPPPTGQPAAAHSQCNPCATEHSAGARYLPTQPVVTQSTTGLPVNTQPSMNHPLIPIGPIDIIPRTGAPRSALSSRSTSLHEIRSAAGSVSGLTELNSSMDKQTSTAALEDLRPLLPRPREQNHFTNPGESYRKAAFDMTPEEYHLPPINPLSQNPQFPGTSSVQWSDATPPLRAREIRPKNKLPLPPAPRRERANPATSGAESTTWLYPRAMEQDQWSQDFPLDLAKRLAEITQNQDVLKSPYPLRRGDLYDCPWCDGLRYLILKPFEDHLLGHSGQ